MKKFKIDLSFWCLIILILLSPKQAIILKLILALFIHEFAHILVIILTKRKIAYLKLSILGFMMKLEKNKPEFSKDILIYAAGIIANLFCYVVFKDEEFRMLNLILLMVNILPIYPLDGFNIIKSILAYFFPYYFVTNALSYLSILLSAIMIIVFVKYQFDLFIILNLIYLLFINFIVLYYKEKSFNVFLLDKELYDYKLKKRKIKIHSAPTHYLFYYHDSYIDLNGKIINQKELLAAKKVTF